MSFLSLYVPIASVLVIGITYLEIRDDRKEGVIFSKIGWICRVLALITIYGGITALLGFCFNAAAN